jgi:hypothetical protein
MTLVLGSCRVQEHFKDNNLLCTVGHTFSTSDTLQALKIMRGDVVFDDSLSDYYRGWGYKKDKVIKWADFDSVFIEISSVKNYVYNKSILHIGYPERTEFPALDGVCLEKESPWQIMNNLMLIYNVLHEKNVVFTAQHNLFAIPVRYEICTMLSKFCKLCNLTFIDPTSYMLGEAVKYIFRETDGRVDYYHFTEYFANKMWGKYLK